MAESEESSAILSIDCSSISSLDDYDLPLHIAAIFILVAVSLAGSLFPIFFSSLSTLKGNKTASKNLLRLGVMFGSGTLLATGFIHMLMPAIAALSNPCAPALFTEEYTAFAALFAMLAILLMQLLQITLSVYLVKPIPSDSVVPTEFVSSNNMTTQKRIAVSLLEIGIATHSIIIGLALGLATGEEFTALLIALCFHQYFEGLALGSSIVDAKFESRMKSILMASIYGVTTPLGIGIGIAVRFSFVPNSPEALVTIGVFDAFSAGILIYTALVEFIAPQVDSLDFKAATPGNKALQLLFLYLGVGTMAIIGKYA